MTMLRRIGLFAIVVGVLIAVLVWSLPMAIPFGLAVADVDDVTFGSIEIGFRRARLDALAIGKPPQQSVATIEAHYSLQGLLNGRIDRVWIDGLVVQATYADGALSFDDAIESDVDGGGPGDDRPFNLIVPFVTEDLAIENSQINVETSAGPVSLPVNGRVSTADDRLLFDLDVPSAALTARGLGTLKAKLQLAGHLPLTGVPRVDQAVASGRLNMQAANITLPGREQQIAMKSAMDLNFANGRLTLSGPLAVTGQNGSVDGKLSAAVVLDDQLRPAAIEGGEAAFELTDLRLDDSELDHGKVTLRLDGALDGLAGELALDFEGLTTSLGTVEVRGIKMQRVLDLALSDRVISVTARTVGDKISVDRVAIENDSEQVMESGWFTLQWPSREEPWLRFHLDDHRFELDWALEIDPVRIDLAASPFWARIEDLAVTLTGDPQGLRDGAIRLRQGRADLPSANLALTGIESDIVVSDWRLATDRPIPLTIRAVRPLEEPRFFSPLRFDAQIDAEALRFGVDGTLTSTSSARTVLDFAGRHDVEINAGALDLKLAPLTFDAGQLQPGDLSPILDGVIDQAEGRIALDGRIAWQGEHAKVWEILDRRLLPG